MNLKHGRNTRTEHACVMCAAAFVGPAKQTTCSRRCADEQRLKNPPKGFHVRLSSDTERQILELIKAGLTSVHVAEAVGVSLKTVQNVFNRSTGIRRCVGRPNTTQPLTEAQAELVEAFHPWAQKLARRLWRAFSDSDKEREEYSSAASLGLVKAACRWQGDGVFQKWAFVFIKGEIKTYRKTEALANGWGLIEKKLTKLYVRACSETHLSGEAR